MKPTVECKQNRQDCCNYFRKGCVALENTEFDYKCPFYRSKAENAKIIKECAERNAKA